MDDYYDDGPEVFTQEETVKQGKKRSFESGSKEKLIGISPDGIPFWLSDGGPKSKKKKKKKKKKSNAG